MNLKKIIVLAAIFISVSSFAQTPADTATINLEQVIITASRMKLPLKSIPQKVELISQRCNG